MESKLNIFKAISEFQKEVPCIHKDTVGFGYTYADLPTIIEIINPLLDKHKLAFTQPIQGNSIQTIVFHVETGEFIESFTEIPTGVQLKGMNDFQVLGSAITYLRRYSLSSILGLVTDKDNDANGLQKNNAEKPNNNQNKTDDKPWLNVFGSDKKTHTKQWQSIIDRLSKGEDITISKLREYYKISKEVESEFNKLKN